MATFLTERTWGTREVAQIIDAPLSTVDRWAAAGLFPADEPMPGQGRARRFVFKSVVMAALCKVLADHAVPLELIGAINRQVADSWPDDDPNRAGAFLCSPGGSVVALGGMPEPGKPLIGTGQAWAIAGDGQASGLGELVFLVNVGDVARRIRARIEELDKE